MVGATSARPNGRPDTTSTARVHASPTA
jgi:hypothetical protein